MFTRTCHWILCYPLSKLFWPFIHWWLSAMKQIVSSKCSDIQWSKYYGGWENVVLSQYIDEWIFVSDHRSYRPNPYCLMTLNKSSTLTGLISWQLISTGSTCSKTWPAGNYQCHADSSWRWGGFVWIQVPEVCSNLFPRKHHPSVFQETTETSIVATSHTGRSVGKYLPASVSIVTRLWSRF